MLWYAVVPSKAHTFNQHVGVVTSCCHCCHHCCRWPYLQVLGCNIFALVRHAAHPQNLHSLRELHVEMVGSMEGSCIEPGGLLMLPQLTRLVMTINNQVMHMWW